VLINFLQIEKWDCKSVSLSYFIHLFYLFLKNILVILMRHSYFKDRQREEIMSNLENEIHTQLY